MFMIEELDNILKGFVSKQGKPYSIRITVPDVAPISIDKKFIDPNIKYIPDSLVKFNGSKSVFDIKEASFVHENLGTDFLFLETMNKNVISRLISNKGSSSRFLICDSTCYDLFVKYTRILRRCQRTDTNDSLLLYKSPFDFLSILKLSEVVDLFGRQQKPFLFKRFVASSSKPVFMFNYWLVRAAFPYLKMSDLIVMLWDVKDLDLNGIDESSSKEILTLRLLNHFARTISFIEVGSLNKLLDQTHPMYDNVIILKNDRESNSIQINPFARYPDILLLNLASQVANFIERLKVKLCSISYRSEDPYEQTRALAQLLEANFSSRTVKTDVPNARTAKVLIIDRFFNLSSPFLHADRYGPFCEQEKLVDRVNDGISRPIILTLDDLDERLHLVLLTQTLSSIIEYTINMKPSQSDAKQANIPKINKVLSSYQSINRHLDIVRSIYKCLYDGYLLMNRLETSLISLQTESLQEGASVERLQRISVAINSLIENSGNSLRANDIARLLCILVDVLNKFLAKFKKNQDSKSQQAVIDIKRQILYESSIKSKLKLNYSSGENDMKLEDLIKAIHKFDSSISLPNCYINSDSIQEVLKNFNENKLNAESYKSLDIDKSKGDEEILILIFIGTMTPNELALVKSYEANIKQKGAKQIYIFSSSLADPDEFIKALRL